MAWIRFAQEDEATGETRQVYSDIMQRLGTTTLVTSRKVMGLRPNILRAADELSQQVSKGRSGLSGFREELIALLVSERLHCEL